MNNIETIKLSPSEMQAALGVKRALRLVMPLIILSYVTTILLSYFAASYMDGSGSYLYNSGLSLIGFFSLPIKNLVNHLVMSMSEFRAAYVYFGTLSSLTFSLILAVLGLITVKKLTLDYYIYLSQGKGSSYFKGIAADIVASLICIFFAFLLIVIVKNVDLVRIYEQQSYRSRGIYLVLPAFYQVCVLLFLVFLMQSKKVLLLLRDERFR
ncbi:hypothetical protein KBI52_20000 [Microvirga sp. HBU67558]|uniref:hypothetical protein n=1 Tax=Microvirga TaxID=186650 RepID=UPI001B35ACB5|nr:MULTISPECIES: hypothetical protein [unclassified Microvirga]MBQ0822472.1 hypothetical protein [Microvirga sp. HBU67558]